MNKIELTVFNRFSYQTYMAARLASISYEDFLYAPFDQEITLKNNKNFAQSTSILTSKPAMLCR